VSDRTASGDPVAVDRLMREIEDRVRRDRRTRLLARGGAPEYRDPAIYAAVEEVLRRALDDRDHDTLLLPAILGGEEEWGLRTHLDLASHRTLLGPLILFVKRRVLLPATRWLYEYSLENFRRQQRMNRLLLAFIEELAIENARLRKAVATLQGPGNAESVPPVADGSRQQAP
jgi:hypothetical protein